MKALSLESLIFLAGIGHVLLSVGSLLIPKLLSWKSELVGLKPLFRQMFWNYAGYILATNLFFGIISVANPAALTDRSFLAIALTAFISIYWVGRIAIQLFYFDRSSAPKGTVYTIGEILLMSSFLFFSVVYGYALVINLSL